MSETQVMDCEIKVHFDISNPELYFTRDDEGQCTDDQFFRLFRNLLNNKNIALVLNPEQFACTAEDVEGMNDAIQKAIDARQKAIVERQKAIDAQQEVDAQQKADEQLICVLNILFENIMHFTLKNVSEPGVYNVRANSLQIVDFYKLLYPLYDFVKYWELLLTFVDMLMDINVSNIELCRFANSIAKITGLEVISCGSALENYCPSPQTVHEALVKVREKASQRKSQIKTDPVFSV